VTRADRASNRPDDVPTDEPAAAGSRSITTYLPAPRAGAVVSSEPPAAVAVPAGTPVSSAASTAPVETTPMVRRCVRVRLTGAHPENFTAPHKATNPV
jgi:hypothetical protein